MENHFTTFKFKDLGLKNKKYKKEYLLKRINIKNFPKMKKSLDIFFNDSKRYFDTIYEDKFIVVGKKNNNKNNYKLINIFKDTPNKIKTKNMNLLKRMTLLKAGLLKSSNDGSNKSTIKNSKMITEEKKKVFTNEEENKLKPGQRFIEDKEVENLFNLYKEVRRINKNRNNNFVTLKELNEKRKNNNNFKSLKESINLVNKNENNLSKNSNKKMVNSVDKKMKKSDKKINNLLLSKQHKIEFDNNLINEKDFYKTVSTGFSNNFQDELNIKTDYLNSDENRTNKLKSTNIKEIKERQNLIERQNQYLEIDINKIIKNKFSDILALQERTFRLQSKNNNSQTKLNNYLSSRIKRPNDKRLLLQDENYRPNLEIKIKLNNYHKKLHPDGIYNWYKDLHSSEKFEVTDEHLPTVETIRNPFTMKFYSTIKNRFLEDNDYLKKIMPKKSLRNISDDFRNIQNNYDSLSVKGVNLLKFENNIFKKLKGRKIMNDFERLMTPSSVKSKNIYSNVDKNIFTQKTKSSLKLPD